MSNVSFHCDETSCSLLIHGLVTEFKERKVGGLLQQSEDQSVRDIVPELYTGKKWKFAVKASNIDSITKMSKVMGNAQVGRTGLGYLKRSKRFNSGKQQSHRKFQEVIKKGKNESLYTKAAQQSIQG